MTGDSIRGNTSNDVAQVIQVTATELIVQPQTALSGRVSTFTSGESITNNTRSGSATLTGITPLYASYIHEKGKNAVTALSESAIYSMFETSDFGLPTGGSTQNNQKGLNRWTRLVRIEPDFNLQGEMGVQVVGREFAQDQDTESEVFTFDSNTGKIDMREQRRQIRLRFISNVVNGDFEMGRVILHTEPGDGRS